MKFTFINRTNLDLKTYQALFRTIAKATEKELNLPPDYEVSITFVRSVTIHKINYEYRNIDSPTDVITFASLDAPSVFGFLEEMKDLGDIFINVDYARKQARQYGHSIRREYGFLFLHGLLHCLGYDHQTKAQEQEMFLLQDQILDRIVQRI